MIPEHLQKLKDFSSDLEEEKIEWHEGSQKTNFLHWDMADNHVSQNTHTHTHTPEFFSKQFM